MIIINNVNTIKFSLDGIEYYKNFTPVVQGGKVKIVNTYDSKIELIPLTEYNQITLDSVIHTSIEALQTALLPVVFTRDSLGGGGGGSGDMTKAVYDPNLVESDAFDMDNMSNPSASKTTPIDADDLTLWDSVASVFKRLSYSNLKATLKTYFDTLYASITLYAVGIISVPSGNLSATNVQAALNELQADIDSISGGVVSSKEDFTATSSQTVFTLTNSPANVDVFKDSLLLEEGVDYTFSGNTVTLTTGAFSGSFIEVRKYNGLADNEIVEFTNSFNRTFDATSVSLTRDTFTQDNYLTNTGAAGGQPGYVINKYQVSEGVRYKITGQITTLNTTFGAFGFYSSTDIGDYVGGIVGLDNGVNNIEAIVTAPAGSTYIFVTQDSGDFIEVREELQIQTLVESPNKPNNLHSNYQLETAIGSPQTNGNTALPLYHLKGLDNSTDLGYQVSDCPTGFPSMKFNLGTSGASPAYMLTGIQITDSAVLEKIKGQSVTFSYYIKHSANLSGIYLNRVQGDVTDVDYTDKTQNNNTGDWYKVEHVFTMTSSDISQLILRSYPNTAIGVNADVELSSFSLKLTANENVDYLFTENARWESLRNTVINASVELVLPDDIYIVHDNRLEIFKHSIVKAINPENYFLNIEVVSGTPKGNFYDRVYTYDCVNGDGVMVLKFVLKNSNYDVLDEKTVTITPLAKGSNPASAFNVLMIGDSFTATSTYPAEFARRLQGTGGTPTADNLTNINFIGTAQSSPNREGASGQSWEYFIGASSPFWNGSAIDFDDYCTDNSYSQIDAVVIMLGTNSTSTNADIQELLDALITHNASIKGVITGIIYPTPLGGSGTAGLSAGQTFYGAVSNIVNYNRRLEALINDSYSSNFVYCDVLSQFDLMYNMQYSNVAANKRNATTVKQGADNVHPASEGYLQIADIIYSPFHQNVL